MIPAIVLTSNVTVAANIAVPVVPKTYKRQRSLRSTFKSLTKSGKLDEALRLIECSPSTSSAAEPDLEAYSLFLHTCISRKSLEHGQRLFFHLLLSRGKGKNDLLKNPNIKSKFITLYSICGLIDEARRVFEDGLEDEHVPESVWVAMAIGFSRNGCLKEALFLYCDMLSRSIQPGNFAFSMALKACADLSEFGIGRAIHAQIIKCDEEPDQVVNNALLRLYAELGCLYEGSRVFEEMPQRNVVSWNSLIASFLRHRNNFV